MALTQWLSENHICEHCGNVIHEYYGTGRFCSSQCAHSFSTSKNREEINKKVSKTLANKYVGKRKSDIEQIDKQNKLMNLLNQGYVYVNYPNIDFGNKYLINEFGEVISLRGFRKLQHNAYSWKDKRYKRLNLMDVQGKLHGLLVHRLVAHAFIPNPNNLPFINHKDENPSNNHKDNLEWCDYQYNNTYNDIHIKRGKVCAETIRQKGGPHNKGVPMTEEQKKKLSQIMRSKMNKGV